MGCAAAWALAERGADVTVVEQFELEHARGSSHGRTRIVRVAYPEPDWVRLAAEAMRGWRELEAQSGEELLGLYGLVELASSPELTSASALDACGLEYRLLDGGEARAARRRAAGGMGRAPPAEAGVVRADLARRAFLDVAVSRGARVETGRRVVSPDDVDADVVVVTAGAWVTDFVAGPSGERHARDDRVLPPRRAGVAVGRRAERGDARARDVRAARSRARARRPARTTPGRRPIRTTTASPMRRSSSGSPRGCGERLPDVDPEPVGAETCIYTSTADESFVLERRGRVVVGSACSGHGFKFAPAVGRRLAALALD